MNNKQICQEFYNGRTRGKASNIFIEGDILYSYGHHFPMAVKIGNEIVAWNEDRYSNSTSKHQNHAYPYGHVILPCNTEAIKEWEFVKQCGDKYKPVAKRITQAYNETCKAYAEQKARKARVQDMKDVWASKIERYTNALALLQTI